PVQYRYAIEKGKHVFMEKPVATCPTGVRIVIEASKLAKQKGLAVVAGTQRRHQASFVETVRRIQEGAIGQIVAAQCYWNGGRPWNRKPDPALTEIEQQMFNWYHYTWLCGDHIVEQHVHNLDVINWCFSTPDALAHPLRCMAVGGLTAHRVLEGPDAQKSTEPGNIWDNFAVEYEYPGGVFVQSYCRHWEPCPGIRSGENLVGTKGTANPSGRIKAETEWRFEGQGRNPYEQEHIDLIESIRAGKPINEGESVAYSTMIAIMGRMAAYTGQNVTWDFVMNQSQLNFVLEDPKPGPHPVDPIAVPGKTKLI
ncbi:MAG: gfo/Idh/MocA family oxidoreductase, partial [Armatimonadota bacterium]|nr:gfo/Idh/MocA family oxidoreductase [Armatimonadota bacterium]